MKWTKLLVLVVAVLLSCLPSLPSSKPHRVVHQSSSYSDFIQAGGDGHMHTTYSSGTTTVHENSVVARERNLSWIFITDHNVIPPAGECEAENEEGFRCLLGEEVTTTGGHVLAWGVQSVVNWSLNENHTMEDIFHDIHEQGGLAVVAHPFDPTGNPYEYFGRYDDFDAIEIYHGHAGFNDNPLTTDMDGKALRKWEEYLNMSMRKIAVGNSDCHNASDMPDGGDLLNRRGAIGYPRNIVYTRDLSLSGILSALRAGRSYVTDGPLLNFTINDHILGEFIYLEDSALLMMNISGVAIETSEVNIIRNGTKVWSATVSPGPFSLSHSYNVSEDSWFRSEIRTHNDDLFHGETEVAFTNPIFVDLKPYDLPAPPSNLTATLKGNDVLLHWNASPGRVTSYDIYVSKTIDGFNFSLPFDSTTSTNWTHESAGVGNLEDYFYIVRAVGSYGREENNTFKAAKISRLLKRGPQFISIPLIVQEQNPGHVFRALNFDWVRSFNSSCRCWKAYWRDKSYGGLDRVSPGTGLWINMRESGYLVIAGRVPSEISIRLESGWNMVGYASFRQQTVAEALRGITYEKVEGIDELSPPFLLRKLSSSDIMQDSRGYWVKVKSKSTWVLRN